jgi:hypothetical protein
MASSAVGGQLGSAMSWTALTAGKHLAGLPRQSTKRCRRNNVVQAGDTWASIANYLYGTSNVAEELRLALNNVALNAGTVLTPLPYALVDSAGAAIVLTRS